MSIADKPLDELMKDSCTINGAEFRFNKAKGIKGFALMEKARVAIGKSGLSSAIPSDNDTEESAGRRLIASLMSIDSGLVLDFLNAALEYVDVKLPSVDRAMPYLKIKAEVENVLSPADYYELLARFICVNFTASVRDLMLRLGLR